MARNSPSLPSAQPHRTGPQVPAQGIAPQDIQRPGVARDPGVRAGAAQVVDPRGQALSGFSRDMSAVSLAFKKLHDDRQAAEDAIGIDHGQLLLNQEFEPAIAEMLSSPDTARPDFPKRLDQRLEAIQRDAMDRLEAQGVSLSPDGRRQLERAAMQLRIGAARRASTGAHNQRVALIAHRADENISTVAALAGETGDIDGAFERLDNTLGALKPVLAPDAYRGKRDNARLAVLSSAVEGHIRRGRPDLAQGLVDRFTGFVKEERPEGETEPGNIDLASRPIVLGDDGNFATLKSISVNLDGSEVLIPTIEDDGTELNEDEAVERYRRTGQHLGKFESPEQATAYAKSLSDRQGNAVVRRIAEAAKDAGVDPATALAISWIESKFNPTARNPKSTAGGLFQFISETGGKYGLPPDASTASVADQAGGGAQHIADNAQALRRALGTEPTPADLYLAHFLGAPRAIAVLRAGGDTPISAIVGPKAYAEIVKANPFLANWTAGRIYGWAAEKMQEGLNAAGEHLSGRQIAQTGATIPIDRAMQLGRVASQAMRGEQARLRRALGDDLQAIRASGEGIGVDEEAVLRMLPAEEVESWRSRRNRAFEDYDRATNAAERAAVVQDMADDLRALDAGGEGDPVDPDRIRRTFGVDRAANYLAERELRRDVARATDGLATMNDRQIEERLISLEPPETGAGAAHASAVYAAAVEEVERVRKLRETDPHRAALEVPAVRDAHRAIEPDNPESRAMAIQASLNAQAAMGVPAYLQSPLSLEQARAYARALQIQTGDDPIAVADAMIEQIVRDWGEALAPNVFGTVMRSFRADRAAADALYAHARERGVGRPMSAEQFEQLRMQQDLNARGQAVWGPDLPMDEPQAIDDSAAESVSWTDWLFGRSSAQARPDQYSPGSARLDPDDITALRTGQIERGVFDEKYGRGAASHVLTQIRKRSERQAPQEE